MSFFKSLADIGISRSELIDIGSENTIRIEKKLLAELRLNESISKNDIEQILKVIKNYPDVIKIVCSYDCFYGILNGYDAEYIDTLAIYKTEQLERIRYVVSEFFRDEILAYLNTNVNANNWNNLRVLLHYRLFFTKEITDAVVRRLEGKIESAIGIMQQKPAYKELNAKVFYIKEREFYVLLSELDSRNFDAYIYKLIDFLDLHVGYVKEKAFFQKMVRSLASFETKNQPLKLAIWKAYSRYARPERVPSLIAVSIILLLVVSFCLWVASIPKSYTHRTSILTNGQESPFGGRTYTQDDQRLKMEDFVEARLYPLNYPLNSWQTNEIEGKYQSPFALDIFSSPNQNIKHGAESINIFNRTSNDCVAIAYFTSHYDRSAEKYVPISNNEAPEIYAVYIPAGDSISIDFKMYLLRFYMGKRPAKFNTYRRYVYPDSLDMKFSKFTSADSLLFSKAFAFGNNDKLKQKQQSLIITQPNNKSYQIAWTGQEPLQQFGNWTDQINDIKLDSATKKKPILFVVKPDPDFAGKSPDEAINSFLH